MNSANPRSFFGSLSVSSILCCAFLALPALRGQEIFTAYQVADGTAGNQDFGGALGLEFDVDVDIRVLRLGVFDDLSDGLKRTLTARLYDRDTLEELASIVFDPDDPGELIGGSRFKDLDEPFELPAGFHGTMVGEGYGAGELNGNTHGGPAVRGWTTDTNCSISFVGGSRFGNAGTYPATMDAGPVNRYAAGTFQFQALGTTVPRGGIAYMVPPFTFGNEAFEGPLGMDFDVRSDAVITRLGVFDDGSDGLLLPLTARLYNRDSFAEMAKLEFTTGDPGELVEGSRLKPLEPPLSLPAGFRGSIVAEGYGEAEKNGRANLSPLGLLTDSGNCLLAFVGTGRKGIKGPGEFPTVRDHGTPDAYAAGTFEFLPSETPVETPKPPSGLQAAVANGHIDLSWTAPVGGLPVTGYNVYRSRGGPFTKLNASLLAGTSLSADAGILRGVDTCFVVRSVAANQLESPNSNEVCAVLPPSQLPAALLVAYRAPAGTVGNEQRYAAIGLDFEVRTDIVVTRLGIFDDGSDGFAVPLTVRLYDRGENIELAKLEFTPDEAGDLVGGSRFKPLAVPIQLPAGFLGTVSAHGFSDAERAASQLAVPLGLTRDNARCSIAFTGARTGGGGSLPPLRFFSDFTDPFAAGTFEYGPLPTPGAPPVGGIAYRVAELTAGNQDDFDGSLGMDFNVERGIVVTRLGVFDDLSDGLFLPLTAFVYDRRTRKSLASLEFTPEDPGDLIGGSRFKDLVPPLVLPAGFRGTMVGQGYGFAERNGNTHGAPADVGWSLDDGSCLVSFVGPSRPGMTGQFPERIDGGPENRYAAGTFQFELLDPPATVARSFTPAEFAPGSTVTVTLEAKAKGPGTAAVLINEVIGGGAAISAVSDGGLVVGNRIEWDLAAVTQKTLTYQLTPSSCAGEVGFDGSKYLVGGLNVPTGGEAVLHSLALGGEPLAAPWTTTAIGPAGGGSQPLGEHAVVTSGGGIGIRGQLDELRFTSFPVTGELEFTVRIDCFEDQGGSGLAGIMVRETLDPFSANAFFGLNSAAPTGGGVGTLKGSYRRETNATTRRSTSQITISDDDVLSLPVYLKLKRTATEIVLERSADGATYSPVGSRELGNGTNQLNLGAQALVGLAVTGGGGTARASFGALSGPPVGGGGGPTFRRGDVDGSGAIDISDPVKLLGSLFLGDPPPDCQDAADTDDSGFVDITDPVASLGFQFLGGPAPPDPGPSTCGRDPTPEANELGCVKSCS